MYQYDEFDQRLVNERVEQFRDQVRRFLDGQIGEEEFKQLRLRNGLYMQRHAHMLRVAIPYGLFTSRQLRMMAYIARTYDRGYGHFTTRQNIQYNWPELRDVPDILADLASVQMHAIQTSGNAVRNITSDHFAGVAADELEDPRPYCEILRQWSTLHPEFSWLPRKFKIAVSAASSDRTASLLHDIGLQIVDNDAGERGFRVLVGGGMGRTPVIGKLIREFLPRVHLLSYVEAILRIYNLLGRRDNIHKARIKILVNQLGIDRFRELVEEEWLRIRDGALTLEEQEIERIRAHFNPPEYVSVDGEDPIFKQQLHTNPFFATWYKQNTRAHKVNGYRIVIVSLKAPGVPPGDINAEEMDALADLADRFSFGQIRATHDQNLVLADVREADIFALWLDLSRNRLATPNVGTLNDMICCPGLDFCSLANAGSIPIAKQINEKFDTLDYLYDIGEIQLKMSGCMNACGHHHVGHIGILGVEKRGEEWYQLTLGGSAGHDAALGERLGAAIEKERVADVIGEILGVYLERREEGERFIDTYRRVGLAPFKERVYANNSKPDDSDRRVAAVA
ncbi:MAG: nitrite/sulfite reductase [Gammaproteobacteria bacterium]|nr:nitrite/sulfite reductase [Gammaproteobacteria bacterium]MDH3412207.1 nitrite/sulfite reductase [Gammaproteobacteria bacterium]